MFRLTSGAIGVDQGERVLFSDYEDDGEMWRGTGQRETRSAVRFTAPYVALPAVQVTLAMGDMSNRTNIRYDLRAENVTVEGFEIVFRTWSDTKIARARVAWMAIGELEDEDNWKL